jgi:hypothetical protein
LALECFICKLLLTLSLGIGIVIAEKSCQKTLGKMLREHSRIRVLYVLNDPHVGPKVQGIAGEASCTGGSGCSCAASAFAGDGETTMGIRRLDILSTSVLCCECPGDGSCCRLAAVEE